MRLSSARLVPCLLLLAALLPAAPAPRAQDYIPRLDFGARLEPAGGLMHGAGQSPDAFVAYRDAMPPDGRPMVYMHYVGLAGLQPDWADALKAELRRHPDEFVVPQIGLSMTVDGTPSAHYEHLVAAGAYDAQIGHLIEGLRRLATPVYLRIGYEFNGVAWNGYEPASYRLAFARVAEMLRAADVEAATVWCGAMDGDRAFFDYYPGDAHVDWFGMDFFSAEHFSDADAAAFLDSARAHGKPVMVGETTPRGVGAQGGAASWTGWFVAFFDFLRANPEVKQFGYINWDWAYWAAVYDQPGWATWGDARLETPPAAYVRERYVAALADPVAVHAGSETAFRQRLGYADAVAPPAPGDAGASAAPGGAALAWAPVSDPSGIARYYLYRNGTLADFALAPPFLDRGVAPGPTTYEVAAMDRAGNLGPRSPALTLTLDAVERVVNGGFEDDLAAWRFEDYDAGAAGTAVADPATPLAGAASARVTVTQSTGTEWHLQLRQFFRLTAGRTYTLRFRARAAGPVTVPVVFQQVAAPFAIYLSRPAALGTAPQAFTFAYAATASDDVAVSFFLGAVGMTSVWVDEVSIEEVDPNVAAEPGTEAASAPALEAVAPNPVRGEAIVSYTLPRAAQVRLALVDLLGREVAVLAEGVRAAGRHAASVRLPPLAAGPYVLRLQTPGGSSHRLLTIRP
jgi:hypothetical protein